MVASDSLVPTLYNPLKILIIYYEPCPVCDLRRLERDFTDVFFSVASLVNDRFTRIFVYSHVVWIYSYIFLGYISHIYIIIVVPQITYIIILLWICTLYNITIPVLISVLMIGIPSLEHLQRTLPPARHTCSDPTPVCIPSRIPFYIYSTVRTASVNTRDPSVIFIEEKSNFPTKLSKRRFFTF